jgi:hypothetical protein
MREGFSELTGLSSKAFEACSSLLCADICTFVLVLLESTPYVSAASAGVCGVNVCKGINFAPLSLMLTGSGPCRVSCQHSRVKSHSLLICWKL